MKKFYIHFVLQISSVLQFVLQMDLMWFLTEVENPIFFSNFNSNCSNLSDMRNLQEKVKKTFWYKKNVLTFHCLNKLFKWSQKFCKFSACSQELQKFFSITRTLFFSQYVRTILVTKYHRSSIHFSAQLPDRRDL